VETRTRRPQATPSAARRWSSRAAASIAIASTNAGRGWARTFHGSEAGGPPFDCVRRWWHQTRRSCPTTASCGSSKEGTTVTGKLLNQDAISVQLMNPKEELKTYLRANLREYTIIDKGLMPSVEGKLTAQQVADIVSYLSSLKGS
jgi:hypothetical protein